MRSYALNRFFFAAVLSLTIHFASAQNEIVVIKRPVEAMQLDGYVRIGAHSVGHDERGEGIPDIRVEECDKTWKQTLNSTVTDKDGHFHLEPTARGVTHYIRISGYGFNPRLYTVKLSKHGSPSLNLEINVAT